MADVDVRVLESDPYSEKTHLQDPARAILAENLMMRKVLACLVRGMGGRVEIDVREMIVMPWTTRLTVMERPDLNGNVVVVVR